MQIVARNSPNQSTRFHGDAAVRLVICHTPEGSYQSAINTCMTPRGIKSVSYHRIYKKDGSQATQLVPFTRKAWHAGAINSLSDGLSLEGFARDFSLSDPGTRQLARGVAERLVARGLPCQWTTDPRKGGFCRHGDLQSNRSDPTPDLVEFRRFAGMVRTEYDLLTKGPDNAKRLAATRAWILARVREGWAWNRIKQTANWREFKRRGGH